MKSYKNLYEKFISEDNIKAAIQNSAKGKRNKRVLKKAKQNPDKYIPIIKEYVIHYKNANHLPRIIYDGISRKKRTIIVPTWKELVVQHMLIQVLEPMFMRSMYEHSYGSIPGRGAHKAKKRIEKWIKQDPKGTKYCGKFDIKKFFDSVDHDILKKKLRRKIKDKRIIILLDTIIDVTTVGIPLGFYTSQWFGNFILEDLDHKIKELYKAKYYVRYMDDMVIFNSNKRKAHEIGKLISGFLTNELNLKMKENWQIFKLSYIKNNKEYGRPLDFMGFKFYRNRTTLRKSILKKLRKKALRIKFKVRPTIYDAKQMLSYLGYIKAAQIYNYYLKYIKPCVNIQYCKRKVAREGRKLCYIEKVKAA